MEKLSLAGDTVYKGSSLCTQETGSVEWLLMTRTFKEIKMQRGLFLAILVMILHIPAANAQDKKPVMPNAVKPMVLEVKDLGPAGQNKKPTPTLAKDRALSVGQFFARVTEYDAEKKKMKLIVPYRVPVLNTDSVARLAELQQETLGLIQIEDFMERAREALRIRMEIFQTQANLYSFEDHEFETDLPLAEMVKIRLIQPNPKYNDMGKLVKFTAKELAELKLPANLPGYKGEFEDLRDKLWIHATVVRSTSTPHPHISMVVIYGTVGE